MTRAVSEQNLAKKLNMSTNVKTNNRYEPYNMKLRKINEESEQEYLDQIKNELKPGETVYTIQLRKMREKIRNDKDYVYTWSDNYLSASLDPYTIKEKSDMDNSRNKSKILTENGFQTLIKN